MNKEQLIQYLKHRIECVQSFLRDVYTINSNDILVIKAETELNILEEILTLIAS